MREPELRDPVAGEDSDAEHAGRGASRAAASVLLLRLGSFGLIFLGSVALARTLGPDARGAHGFVISLTALLGAVLSLSAPVGAYILVLHRGAPAKEVARIGSWHAPAAGLLGLAVGWGFAVTGLAPAPLSAVPLWPVLLGIGVAGTVFVTYHLQVALGRGRAVPGAVLAFAPFSVAAVGYLALAAVHGGLAAALVVFALSPWLTMAVAFLIPSRPFIPAGRPPAWRLVVGSARQGLRTYPGDLANMAHLREDVILLGLLAPAAALGAYVVAYQTAEPILALSSAAAAAVLAHRPGQASDVQRAVVERLVREAMLVGLVVAVVAIVTAPIVIPLVYGPAFQGSVVPFMLLLPAVIALSIGRIVTADLTRRNQLGTTAAYAIAATAFNLVANLVLIPRLGAVGAALASLMSYTSFLVMAVALDSRIGGVRWRRLLPRGADLRDLLALARRGR